MSMPAKIGFVGLGNMGGPMAANIAKAGFDLTVYDKAGAEGRTPPGAAAAASMAEVISVADTTFLSLPDGKVSVAVARDIAALSDRATTTVIDLSTIGIAAAQEAEKILADAGTAYIDAPVSGGAAGGKLFPRGLGVAVDDEKSRCVAHGFPPVRRVRESAGPYLSRCDRASYGT